MEIIIMIPMEIIIIKIIMKKMILKKSIKRLKDCEFGLSLTLFFFSIIFFFTLKCFISKNCLIAGDSFFCLQFFCSTFPLIIYFFFRFSLNNYKNKLQ